MLNELEKLEANLGGVADMKRQPDAIFIVDLRKEQLAVREAQRLGCPVIALVDTNCDPDEADYIIPGNDDAIRSCSLIVRAIADGIAAGQHEGHRAGARGTPRSRPPPRPSAPEAEKAAAGRARQRQPRDGGRGRRGRRDGRRARPNVGPARPQPSPRPAEPWPRPPDAAGGDRRRGRGGVAT